MKLYNTSGKYLNQILKLPLGELKMRKSAQEAFSSTMVHPMKIVEDCLKILDKDGCLLQVFCFPGQAGVKVLVDALKKYDPDYDDSVRRKSCLNKIRLVFEFFNSTYHYQMIQCTIEFRFCGVYGCHICGRFGRIVHTPVMTIG